MPYAPCEGGIYAIFNTITEHRYIGSAKHFKRRKYAHFKKLRNNIHPNPHLQAAFNKYGESAFIFEIVEVVSDMSILTEREQHYLDTLNPEYNIRRIATSNIGIKFGPRSEKFKQFMSENMTGQPGVKWTDERKASHGEKLRGRKRTPEVIENYASKQRGVPCPQRGRKGRVMKPESIAKMVATKSERNTPSPIKGVPKSDIARQRMSESAKRRCARAKEMRNANNLTLFE